VVGRFCEGGLAGRVSCPSACLPLLRYLKYRRSLIAPTEKKPETAQNIRSHVVGA